MAGQGGYSERQKKPRGLRARSKASVEAEERGRRGQGGKGKGLAVPRVFWDVLWVELDTQEAGRNR